MRKNFLHNDVSLALKKKERKKERKESLKLMKNTVDVDHMPEWQSSR
jgi:hypothetical protein